MGFPLEESDFAERVRWEIEGARQKHLPINSLHEGYAVILEELDEFWQEVKKRREQRDPVELVKELVQVAAMCQRVAEDRALPIRDYLPPHRKQESLQP